MFAMQSLSCLLILVSQGLAQHTSSAITSSGGLSMLQARDKVGRREFQNDEAAGQDDWINVCYFTNWARYRGGLINKQKDVFEMGVDANLCTHFMYGFATVKPGANGYILESNDPNADHPTGHAGQDGLCPGECNDATFKANWSDPNGERCDWPCSPTRQYRGYEGLTVGMKRKNSKIKALISVGGWSFNDCAASSSATYGQGEQTCEIFSTIAQDEQEILKFAANIIDFCQKWGFDGFDLDWEYPVVAGHNDKTRDDKGAFQETSHDYRNYVNMLKLLKAEFQKVNPPLLLTAAVGVGKSTADTAYDIPGMSEHLDLINLMTYDLHGAWESRTGCNANLYATEEDTKLGGGVGAGEAVEGYPLSVQWAVEYWLTAGAPASKMTIGLATYGRGWKLSDPSNAGYNSPASGACSEGESTGEAGYRSYYEIQEILANPEAKMVYDEHRSCPYVVYGGEWIGYDNEKSICAKLSFAKSKGLAGSMVWALDLDDFSGEYSGGKAYPLITLMSDGGLSCGAAPGTKEPTASQTSTPLLHTTLAASTTAHTTMAVTTTQVQTTQKFTTAEAVSTTPMPSSSRAASSSTTGSSLTCESADGAEKYGATDAACTAACAVVPADVWPCMDGGPCTCHQGMISTTKSDNTNPTTKPAPATSLPKTTSMSPTGTCLAAWEKCHGEGTFDPCCDGLKCDVQSEWYGQCIPA
eukprot:TRINITY_DN3106_c0_g1_i1.p1 TRINITY_DN3106_c0_g1~~TRINITY_DN3106_c0_g1_i1.p1  ORF type:complete len:699 (+),score=128.61 TRINITY_DN3106_c0_g1_i1:79-2175(+)